ncbi:CPBP family intramembrane glutamic endopeptidase [Haloarcula nitratireducens]|uniref:CPBP family intramembrane metalloprotease n=1 Tax=Haloarcula nitratireducens TaxID=2487749 RepID=A0AAW4P7K9_9EURY|nr:type II CAAX endopeptidase family protein [Halomicroarcula nitratireducens]MBX0293733.1 CPBP family intramembrane metalloprotease [Halomicroarcula nitratireducens]
MAGADGTRTNAARPDAARQDPNRPDTGRLARFAVALVGLAALIVAVSLSTGIRMVVLAPLYMFTPMVAGLVAVLTSDVSPSTVGLRIGRPRWLAAAALVALPLVGLTLALSLAVPGASFDPTANPLPGVPLPGGVAGLFVVFGIVLVAGVTINAVFAFGEEFGWRGYLLWELAPLGFWRASLSVGALWGLWHAPVILDGYNFPSFPAVGVGMMVLACVAFSPLYTYLVVRADSVLAAALLHGVFNGSAGFVAVYARSDSELVAQLVASPVGLAGTAAFGLAAALLAVRGTPELARETLGGTSANSAAD